MSKRNEMGKPSNIHRLRPATLKGKALQQEAARQLLQQTLDDLAAGEIEEVVVLAKCFNGDWIERATPTNHFRAWIGGLQILVSSWIDDYHVNSRV